VPTRWVGGHFWGGIPTYGGTGGLNQERPRTQPHLNYLPVNQVGPFWVPGFTGMLHTLLHCFAPFPYAAHRFCAFTAGLYGALLPPTTATASGLYAACCCLRCAGFTLLPPWVGLPPTGPDGVGLEPVNAILPVTMWTGLPLSEDTPMVPWFRADRQPWGCILHGTSTEHACAG